MSCERSSFALFFLFVLVCDASKYCSEGKAEWQQIEASCQRHSILRALGSCNEAKTVASNLKGLLECQGEHWRPNVKPRQSAAVEGRSGQRPQVKGALETQAIPKVPEAELANNSLTVHPFLFVDLRCVFCEISTPLVCLVHRFIVHVFLICDGCHPIRALS